MEALTHWVCFLFFLRIADVMAPHLSVVFRRLVCVGSFLACWRQDNVNPIPKGPPSSSVANYWPISTTSLLSKVFERLVLVCLGRFVEPRSILPTTKFAYQKGLGTCVALLCMWHTLKSALGSGQEAQIVEGMTFCLPHIFPNPCFLSVSELNCMPLSYKFHLIDHMCCVSIIVTHML